MITTKQLDELKQHLAGVETVLKEELQSAQLYQRDVIQSRIADLQIKELEADAGAEYGDAVLEELRKRIASETARAEYFELEKRHFAMREEHLKRQSAAWERIAAAIEKVAGRLG